MSRGGRSECFGPVKSPLGSRPGYTSITRRCFIALHLPMFECNRTFQHPGHACSLAPSGSCLYGLHLPTIITRMCICLRAEGLTHDKMHYKLPDHNILYR